MTRVFLPGDSLCALSLSTYDYYLPICRGFPGGAVVKNPPANAGDMASSPGPGRPHMPRSS